ncbi:MAG: GNAT family N-acetyltransferase [Saprospiraceae bacterium]|nr:GNAT family N-acetyltransferase [Saprospiraceae bacterium]
MNNVNIRTARLDEYQILTDIMFASKFYWDYPEEYKTLWREELTITPQTLQEQIFFVAEVENKIAGFYSITYNIKDYFVGKLFHPQGLWLENMFIHPSWIRKRIGHTLMEHLLSYCRLNNISKFCFYADPNATGFYERYGGQLLGYYPSPIPGRDLPLYELSVQ